MFHSIDVPVGGNKDGGIQFRKYRFSPNAIYRFFQSFFKGHV